MTSERVPLVLAGAGHAHLVAIRRWIDAGWRAPAGTLLLSPTSEAWYSGMMPGLIAGRFRPDECAIELQALCETIGITFRQGSVQHLDWQARILRTDDGPIPFDVLSINTGSIPPAPDPRDHSVALVPAKPFPCFTRAWQQWRDEGPPRHMTILGGGPAAFELALALRRAFPDMALCLLSDRGLLEGHPGRLVRYAEKLLRQRHVDVRTGWRIDHTREGTLWSASCPVVATDVLVLASGAAPLPWYTDSGLPTRNGFFAVDPTLQSSADSRVFAAGDCIDLPGALRSGVYAVRQGATLAHNLRATLEKAPLQQYQPRSRSLALLSTADGGALLSYGRWSARGRLPGLWKDHLDLGFMKRHRL